MKGSPRSGVRKMRPVVDRFAEKHERGDGCWNWMAGFNTWGYGSFWLDGKNEGAHRVAYELYVGPVPDGLSVLHRCDNPACVKPAHLYVGTQLQNRRDAVQRGRTFRPRGELSNNAKLTAEQVREIRRRYANGGILQRELAAEYGVHKVTIQNAIAGTTWGHLAA